ncbi:hypothetical protein BACCELL_00565 [Bacteroides cellulosilyticus DSM 14838]|uniref:Uncharacterized protein n=1 Tax=Bacteroides cellulosilyticus DSM 14838 TaxID=537012 RepID=E2N8H0_9BACE|nr:hypothetical protein BACCELL_00565 [Bacteroides cellulosilyticus DSM 14838]
METVIADKVRNKIYNPTDDRKKYSQLIFFVLKSISNDNFHYLCPELVSDEHFCHLD